jgi:hypothetical protein
MATFSGFPGPHRDLQDLERGTVLADRGGDVVFFAGGNAARGDEDVAARGGFAYNFCKGDPVVPTIPKSRIPAHCE